MKIMNLTPVKITLKSYLKKLDDYTLPRDSTAGDLEASSYFQSGIHAFPMGYALYGLSGGISSIVSSSLGILIKNKTNSDKLGFLIGTLSGMIMGGVLGSHAGPLGIVGALVEGGLLGTFTMFRGEAKSIVRDSGGGAVMLDGLFMPGVSKVAGGIASAIASKYTNSNKNKLILGAISGALLGGVLAASGFVPLGAGFGSIICALSGGLGPFFGPRFSQFFRNLSQDCGKLLVKTADNLKIIKKNLPEKIVNSTGAFPACFLKEGIRTYIYSNGSLGAIIVSAITETIEQIHIFLISKSSQNKSCIE